MSTQISELKNKRNNLLSQSQEILSHGLTTLRAKDQFNALGTEIDDLQGQIESLEEVERFFQNNPGVAAPAPAPTFSIKTEDAGAERRSRLNAAYRHLLKHGRDNVQEQRDVLTSGDGSAIIPQEFQSAYTLAQKFYGPIATLVQQTNSDSGRPWKFTVSDDTASAMTYLSESGSTTPLEEDPTFEAEINGTDSLVTTVKYSLQMLDDAFSLEAFLRDVTGLRVSRAIEYALTLGKDNGTNTALPNSPAGGLLGNVEQGAETASLAAGIPYSSLVSLAGSVDHAYYCNGAYMASPSVFNYLVGQTDSTGRPLYKFDKDTGKLMIAGKPLHVNNAMPAFNVASSPVVLFGDFSRAYAYLNGGGIKFRVLTERYADTFEGALLVYHRLGAVPLVSGAVKSLVTAAS